MRSVEESPVDSAGGVPMGDADVVEREVAGHVPVGAAHVLLHRAVPGAAGDRHDGDEGSDREKAAERRHHGLAAIVAQAPPTVRRPTGPAGSW